MAWTSRPRVDRGLLWLAVLGAVAAPAGRLESNDTRPGLEALRRQAGYVHQKDAGSERLRWFRAVDPSAGLVVAGEDPHSLAMGFLEAYGPAFGVHPPDVEVVGAIAEDGLGMAHVRMRQLYRGVPVTGAELVVHVRDDRITAVHGTTLDVEPPLDVEPSTGPDRAAATVTRFLTARRGVPGADVVDVRLQVFDRDVFDGGNDHPARLAWFVTARVGDSVRFAWVDAETDGVLLEFEQTARALDRSVYDAGGTDALPGTLVRAEGAPPVGDPDADGAYDVLGDAHGFFLDRFARDGWNGSGAPIVATVHHCAPGQACGASTEAYWDPTERQLVFGDGMAVADDIVAHEFTHAVIDATAGLFSYMQSGALAESLADMFGEAVDLTNGRGSDEPTDRWSIGEDLTNPDLAGGIREMMNPEYWGDPGTVSDIFCLDTFRDERGGVYWNCGVPNRAFALMVDGGFVGTEPVTGIGLDAAVRVQYRALTVYLTAASNFVDYYHAVRAACDDLVLSGDVTTADCGHVTVALEAVELDTPWACSDSGTESVELPPPCADGLTVEDLYVEDFESPASAPWAPRAGFGAQHWTYPPPADREFATSGRLALYGSGSNAAAASSMETTAGVVLPPDARLRFRHSYGLDGDTAFAYDVGVIRYSVDGGSTWHDAGDLIVAGAVYNGSADAATDNPLAGTAGFVGDSYGYTATEIDLASLAGQELRLGFELGTSSKTFAPDIGWFIDDVRLYACASCDPPAVPTGLAATSAEIASGEMYVVSWTVVEGADRYAVEEATAADFSDATSFAVTGTSAAARHEVEEDTVFHYRVRAVRDCGESSDWSAPVTVTVLADAAPTCSFEVSPTTVSFPSEGGTGTVAVATDAGCVWTAESAVAWIMVASTDPVTGPGEVGYSVAPYGGDTDRVGTLTVAGSDVRITQGAVPCLAEPPTAAISIEPWPAEIGQTVTFTDSGTGERDSRQWTVDDGTTVVVTSGDPSFTHVFSTPGIYSARLEVDNCAGGHVANASLRVVDPDEVPVVTGLVVPAAVRADGLEGTRWRTDVWLHNPCSEPETVDVVFLPEDVDNTTGLLWALEIELAGRATATLADVIGRLPGLGSGPVKGSLRIEPTGPAACLPVVSSRTANVTPEGTYGQYMGPVEVGPSRPLESHLAGLSNDARYRTNLLLLNLGDSVAATEVRVVGGEGEPLGEPLTRWVPPRSSDQMVRVSQLAGVEGELAPFALRITADADTVVALASVVDNTTGDPTTVVEHDCLHEVLYVPGVAHLEGVQDSVWRSDLAIYNAGQDDCSSRLQFISDDPGDDRPFLDFDSLRPGRQFLFEDVVAFLAGGGERKGSLWLTSRDGGPVPRLSVRTYNLEDDGGTFGQFIPSFGDNEMLWAGERGVLPGVACSADPSTGSRSNIGVLNASEVETARLQLVLYATDGSVGGTRLDYEVSPGGFVQEPLARLLGLEGEDLQGSLEVRVISGGPVGAYVSIIDNRTQDPILVPATPVH